MIEEYSSAIGGNSSSIEGNYLGLVNIYNFKGIEFIKETFQQHICLFASCVPVIFL